MKVKITDSIAARATLEDGETDRVIWDSDVTGFGLRLRPGGKAWILAYRPAGAGRSANTKRMKLAAVDAVRGAADARVLARVTLGRIAAGADPLSERKEARRKEQARVSDLLERYEKDLKRRGYVNRKTVLSGLRARLRPYLAIDVKELAGADLVRIIESLENDGKEGAASDFRSRCSAFLTWCTTKARVIDANPLASYRKTRDTRADRIAKSQHGRALTDEELRKVWCAADPATLIGRVMRFLVLTGCRRGEAGGLDWLMVDMAAKVIRLPAPFVKQGRDHIVPYGDMVADLLSECARDARSTLVFPSSRTGGPIKGWSKLLAPFRTRCGVDFQLHDLRRTCRTGLSRLGVETDVAELALGHARDELEAVYNRDDAEHRLRDAMKRWADHVQKVTEEPTPAPVGVFA